MPEQRSLVSYILLLLLLLIALSFLVYRSGPERPAQTTPAQEIPAEMPAESPSTSTPDLVAPPTASVATSAPASTTPKKAKKASIQATESVPTADIHPDPNEIRRIENPYPNAPLDFETINVSARAALVNIYCSNRSGSVIKPITGSGVIVDPSGIVLTNAHVAQYILLAQSGKLDLFCHVRTGAPAASKWIPAIAYIPSVWVRQHAADITSASALGTGEHDYALLHLQYNIDGTPAMGPFPYLKPDTREAVAFVDDNVLTASYPVEFVGGSVVNSQLYPVTSISAVQKLMTFGGGKADVMSLGGIIQAQKGASGGVVVNQWNRAVGLVTTTSDAATTGERDLHAVSLSYIDRDIRAQTGRGLAETLALSPVSLTQAFGESEAPKLADLLLDVIYGK